MYPLLRYTALAVGCLWLGACSIWETNDGRGTEPLELVRGLRPVYYSGDSATLVFSGPSRPQENNTGIVLFDGLLFVIDNGLGVHVYDNSNPRNPRALVFITIPGVSTLTATAGRLYANNFGDLVTIDVDDLEDARVIDRDVGLFAQPLDFPENFDGFFECYDESRGQLVRWEEADLEFPECRSPGFF